MGGANNTPSSGGNTGFFGGNSPSSGNMGGGKGTSSSPSSYLPQGNAQMVGYSNSLQQPSYGPPPSSYYRPQSQQSYGGMGNSKGTSQPAYGGTGYNTPRLPQMVQPQAWPGTVYGGPSPILGNVYGGPSPTVATPPPKDYTAAPVINRAPIVPIPKKEEVKEDPAVADAWSAYDAFSTDPDNAPYAAKPTTARPASSTAPDPSKIKQPLNPLAPARTDENGTYNANGQRLNRNDDGGYSVYNPEKRGGKVGDKNSTDTVARALSLVRGVVKKDKK